MDSEKGRRRIKRGSAGSAVAPIDELLVEGRRLKGVAYHWGLTGQIRYQRDKIG